MPPPTPSWGWDLKANVAFIQPNSWLSLFPGLAIFVTAIGGRDRGDGLADVTDLAAREDGLGSGWVVDEPSTADDEASVFLAKRRLAYHGVISIGYPITSPPPAVP